jgi:esterase/lipase superfamily enzyme
MHREYVKWYSPSLGRDMELLLFGHAGTPILAFPSSNGRFYEWEDFGMVGALHHQLEGGHNMLCCVDGVDRESFYNRGVDPYVRIKRHQQYEAYIFGEVVPLLHHRGQQRFIIATGASFGAYHAAHCVFKRPWDFGKLISLSGAFDIRSFLDGFYDENVYFSNPVDYLPGLGDPATLDAIRGSHLIFTLGQYDPCSGANYRMREILDAKDIGYTFEEVPGAFGHDWPWWRDQIRRYVG